MSDTSTQVQNLNLQKNQVLQFADQLLKTAEEEDIFWGGWDPDDVSEILNVYRPQLTANVATLEEAQAQAAKAHEMLDKILQTYSGARGCVKLGRCESAKRFAENCDQGYSPMLIPGEVTTYLSKVVREDGLFCIPLLMGPNVGPKI